MADELACEVCAFLGKLHPIFGNSLSTHLDEIYAPFMPSLQQESDVAFFPGSFSPWHMGHTACLTGHQLDHTIVIPDFNPWKEVRENSIWNELKTLWSIALVHNNVSLYSGFLAQRKKNPTVSWLPDLKVTKKWLLMGDDSFLSLHQWKEADTLLESLEGVLVCPRLGDQNKLKEQAENLSQRRSKLKIEFLASHVYENLSSTQIRDQK